MTQRQNKVCAICGNTVGSDKIACPQCGKGVFETDKVHSDGVADPITIATSYVDKKWWQFWKKGLDCDVCSKKMKLGQGYGLSTTQVTTAETYWKYTLSHQWSFLHKRDPEGDTLPMFVRKQAGSGTAWLVCDSCAKLFDFDRQVACKFNHPGARPPGNGPANLTLAGLAAAYAWSELYDSWPSGMALRQEEPPPDASACDFCRRRVYGDEELAAMKESAVLEFESKGGLRRRGGPSKRIDGYEFWIACPLCIARAQRITSTNENK